MIISLLIGLFLFVCQCGSDPSMSQGETRLPIPTESTPNPLKVNEIPPVEP